MPPNRTDGRDPLPLNERIRAALNGDLTAISRLITLAEMTGSAANEVHEAVFPHTGKAHIIGITGSGGAGKSTLISKLALNLTSDGQKVAIIACDPSSPVSGGALLGDRIRMHDLVGNEQVFVRSVATRDSSGGLPLTAFGAADVFDACGFEHIIIETVGTGQNQIDIMQAAHTIIAVSAPGLGDDIQAMKSGLLELAYIHAVTKSDLAGAAKALMELEIAVHMRLKNNAGGDTWSPAVLPLNGLNGDGIEAGSGMALGVDKSWNVKAFTKTGLNTGQIIFLSTDGIWEACNSNGEMFGKEPIYDIIRNHSSLNANEILNAMLESLKSFQKGAKIEDDITLVIIKIID